MCDTILQPFSERKTSVCVWHVSSHAFTTFSIIKITNRGGLVRVFNGFGVSKIATAPFHAMPAMVAVAISETPKLVENSQSQLGVRRLAEKKNIVITISFRDVWFCGFFKHTLHNGSLLDGEVAQGVIAEHAVFVLFVTCVGTL